MNYWNVIFLLNNNPPTKIVLLKRSSNKKFAPNLYTGVGGKIHQGEALVDSAYRELKEETGITEVKLEHFAEVIIDHTDSLHYFWAIYQATQPPHSPDGTLEWTPTSKLLTKPIIPTTLEMLKHWKSQNFSTTPFTIHLETISENGIKKVKLLPKLP